MALVHDKALAHGQERDLHEVSRLAQRVRRGDYNGGALRKEQLKPTSGSPCPPVPGAA